MFIDINGIKMHTVSFGAGEETFIGISGFVADWRVWISIFEELSTKIRCIGYDHRGSGESYALVDTISKQNYVDDLFSIMNKLGIEKCYLGGFSFGGAIALLAALQKPERFKGLILIDTNLPNIRPIDQGMKEFINFIKSDHRTAMESFIESIMPESNIEHIKKMVLHMFLQPGLEVAIKNLELDAEGEKDYPYYNITIPTLIIYGDLDGDYVKESSHYLEKILPDAELVIIKGAAHVPIITRPKEVLDVINRKFNL